MISFREVRKDDIWTLYQWRNDLLTRSMSIDKKKISKSEHKAWFNRTLTSKETTIYIYQNKDKESELFGNVRVDLTKQDIHFLSWTINPRFRKKGYGKKMLKDFVRVYKQNYHARIRVNNIASMNICSSAGFKRYYSRGDLTFWKNY